MAINLLATNTARIDFGDLPEIAGATELTVALTVDVSSFANGESFVTQWGASEFAFMMNVQDTDEIGFVVSGNGANTFGRKTTDSPLSGGGLQRIVARWRAASGGDVEIYVNGALRSDTSWFTNSIASLHNSTLAVQVGYGTAESRDGVDGDYSEIAIWTEWVPDWVAKAYGNGHTPHWYIGDNAVIYCKSLNTSNLIDEWSGHSVSNSSGTNADHPRMFYRSAEIIRFPSAPAGGVITELIPSASLTLTGGTPNEYQRLHEPVGSANLILTALAPNQYTRVKELVTNGVLALTSQSPSTRQRIHELPSFANVKLTAGTPNVRQATEGKVTEQVPQGQLTLSGDAPSIRFKYHEPIDQSNLFLTTGTPKTFQRIHAPIGNGTLQIVSSSPTTRQRIRERPETGSLQLVTGTPVTRQGNIIKSVPSSNLRLVSFNPNIPSRVTKDVKAGGGPKPSKPKIAIIGGQRYKIESYTQLKRILELYLRRQEQELRQVEAKAPKSKKAIRLRKTVTRAETRLAKADEEYKQMIERENEEIILLALGI